MKLDRFIAALRRSEALESKRNVQLAAARLPHACAGPWGATPVRLGDDCAAIPDGTGFLLIATHGMPASLVRDEPRFAGYLAVVANASEIYAMGGRPLAVVDDVSAVDESTAVPLWQGLQEAAGRLAVPVVGGHTVLRGAHDALTVTTMGRAERLLTSFDARPGDDLICAVNLRGELHPRHPLWSSSLIGPADRLRGDYEVLPTLAQSEVCRAAKDISAGGLIGTALALLELSAVGARLCLDDVPRPQRVPIDTWLTTVPSYGFLIACPPDRTATALAAFAARSLEAAVIGRVDGSRRLTLVAGGTEGVAWDFGVEALTGWAPRAGV